MTIELLLITVSAIVVLSVTMSKVSERFGVPALLLFLGIGMLAGYDGPGGIYFDNALLSQTLGVVALAYILFAGGLETDIKVVRKVLKPALSLATLGVLITAVVTGTCARYLLHFSWLESLLIGAIVSSTDAAAVFAVLRSRSVGLKEPLRPLLELESGSNDPMAVFMTIGLIELIKNPGQSPLTLIPFFFQQMILGVALGYVMAKLFIHLINRINLDYEGLYPVLCLGWVLFTYGLTAWLQGSGFLAVYITGLVLGNSSFSHKKSLIRFHDGIAWLMQIVMFVTLGLLVFPSHIVPLIGKGLLITLLLMLVARPVGVLVCLLPFRMQFRKKAMVAWVGLRGSVPIILATFPFMAGIPQADTIFNIVFFVVIASVFIQGTSIPALSRWLKLDVPLAYRRSYPIEFEKMEGIDAELTDVIVPYQSAAVGKRIGELGIPEKCLIVLISRDEKFVIPSGSVTLEGGDVLLVLANKADLISLQKSLGKLAGGDGGTT